MKSITDQNVIQEVLGHLANNPTLLSQTDKFNLSVNDFNTRFQKYIFTAISGLYSQGMKKISVIDIENYLSSNPKAIHTFTEQNGREYIQDILDLVAEDTSGFQYYYLKLKKINLLRDLQKQGFDISDYYCDDALSTKFAEVNGRFENTTIEEICTNVKQKILKLENEYSLNSEVNVVKLTDGLDELIGNLQSGAEIGMPLQGTIYNQVLSGAQKGCLTIRSAPSGCGKTSLAFADACYLAFPIRYSEKTGRWEQEGSNQHILFIITEQMIEQAQKKVLSYLSGIPESVFKYGNFDKDVEKRLQGAYTIMKEYEDNFTIVRIPDPDIQTLQNIIREQAILHKIDFVFYDYIFISPALLSEFRGHGLRNDELLLLMTTALKDLAVELNVGIFTSTQVNASADNNREIRNEASHADSRATMNKADNSIIMARPTNEELDMLKEIIASNICKEPNRVFDVFKVRSGQWSQVRIWSHVDLGTMRVEDLFITDSRLNPIDIYGGPSMPLISDWTDEEKQEIKKVRDTLNGN